jgi:type I restriction enzyme R subunit
MRTAVSRSSLWRPRRSRPSRFLNSREGGTLLVGVADDGTIHGIESDYASFSKSDQDPRDRFQLHVGQIIATSMGDAAATNVRPYIHHVDGHDICRVQVDPSGFPVEAKVIYQKPDQPKETRTEFFVRVANGTRPLDVVQREKYILGRWGTGTLP